MCFFVFFVCKKSLHEKKNKKFENGLITSITILLCYYKNLYKNVDYNHNVCKLTVYKIHNYILFCLYLVVILKNDIRIRF